MDENEKKKNMYNDYVTAVTPTHNFFIQILKAYVSGGLVCILGQLVTDVFLNYFKLDKITAATWCSLTLILISVILTALGLFSRMTKFAGAGLLVPITGFANSVAASAIEFKKEGQVFGVGCKIFTIAGPVILYGILSSWILGVIYWIYKCFI